MPSHKAHCYIDTLLFGRSYPKVHRELDKAFKMYGRSHRALFHNPQSALFIAQKTYPNDRKALLAAQFHILIDQHCSENLRLKKIVEAAAILGQEKSRKKRKRGI